MSKEEAYKPKFGFDIRVKPPGQKKRAEDVVHRCAWEGCSEKAPFRAPKSKHNPREFQFFCQQHIREFNARWNFFEGMTTDEAKDYQESISTGHRPTWKVTPGGTPRARREAMMGRAARGEGIEDPYRLFKSTGSTGAASPRQPKRKLPKQIQEAFFVMKLDPPSSPDKIKARYKELVKKFHPDANRGETGYEERLKRIIDAYQNLKTAGFC